MPIYEFECSHCGHRFDRLQKLSDTDPSICPACDAPGFDTVTRQSGLPCSDCGTATGETRADVDGCVRCDHRERRLRPALHADPTYCGHCNP